MWESLFCNTSLQQEGWTVMFKSLLFSYAVVLRCANTLFEYMVWRQTTEKPGNRCVSRFGHCGTLPDDTRTKSWAFAGTLGQHTKTTGKLSKTTGTWSSAKILVIHINYNLGWDAHRVLTIWSPPFLQALLIFLHHNRGWARMGCAHRVCSTGFRQWI